MMNELTTGDRSVIVFALAQRVDACDLGINKALDAPVFGFEGQQVESASYWIKQRTEAQRTLVRAREVFWS